MTLLLHPTLLSKPGLATAIANRLGGEWEVRRGYCRFRPRQAATVHPLKRVRDLIPPFLRPDPDDPRAA